MNEHSNVVKTVQVFSNGRSRAIRIPKEFEFDGDQVEITLDTAGNLIVHPVKKRSLLEVLASLEPLAKEDFLPEIDDPLPEPVDLDWPDEK
ncbi:antitoxin [Rhizobium sp.]